MSLLCDIKKSCTHTCLCTFVHAHVIKQVACINTCTYLCDMITKACCMHLHTHKCLFVVTRFMHLHTLISWTHCTHLCIMTLSNMLHTFIHARRCDVTIKRVACIWTRIFLHCNIMKGVSHICTHAYICVVASSNQFHAFAHAHMSLRCTKRATHYRTHICPCIVTTSNEFHTFAHNHMTIPLVQPQ